VCTVSSAVGFSRPSLFVWCIVAVFNVVSDVAISHQSPFRICTRYPIPFSLWCSPAQPLRSFGVLEGYT